MNMRAVYVSNQLSLSYMFDNRVYKWWKVIFIQILNISRTNAYLLYRYFGKNDMIHKEFMLEVTEEL